MPRPKRCALRIASLATLPLLLMVAACTDAATPTPAPTPTPTKEILYDVEQARAELAAAKALWEAKGSDSYQVHARVFDGVGYDSFIVTVRNGALERVVLADSGEETPFLGASVPVKTIDELFDSIERTLLSPPWRMSYFYDAHLGYPRSFNISEMGVDAAWGMSLKDYRTLTPQPTPTPPPTPTDAEVAVAHLSQTIPWLNSPPDALHQQAAASLTALWLHEAELGDQVALLPWVIDGLTESEGESLRYISELGIKESGYALYLLRLSWVADMDGDVPGNTEWAAFRILLGVGLEWPELALLIASHPSFADAITHEELQLAELFADFGSRDLELVRRLAALDWVADGVEGHELRLLSAILSVAEPSPALSEYLLTLPQLTDRIAGDLRRYVVRALTELAVNDRDHLTQITAQRWYSDGLNEEEAVLIVILQRAVRDSPQLFQDLLSGHFTQTVTVDLPLVGRVRLWAVQNTPFPEGEALLQRMEEAVRYWEGLIQEPFPTNDVILSVVDPRGKSYGLNRGAHLGTHMRLIRSESFGTVSDVPHETGHYLFTYPRWLGEGVCQFGQAHLRQLNGVQTLEERGEELTRTTNCSNYANIRHFQYESTNEDVLTFDQCAYDLGEIFMVRVFSLIGPEATAAALRDLYVLHYYENTPITEEDIYKAFLTNAPTNRQAAFRNLYRQLHGGPFVLERANFDDDHGDAATAATPAMAGHDLMGELDYLFDFDYFRFQAEEDENYRIAVQHPSLPPEWVTIYAPDGVTQEMGRWKSRNATASGLEILWRAPAAGIYYVAVRNFGGLTGTYALRISPVEAIVDDHGDAADSATTLHLAQPLSGTVDGDLDLDYFRFRTEQGRWHRVVVTSNTLESVTVALYFADGATPAVMRDGDVQTIIEDGREWIDIVDLKNLAWPPPVSFDWIAPQAGDYILVVSSTEGMGGAYVVAIRTHNP